MASQNRKGTGARRGPGRPFAPGNSKGGKFKPGQSGNPGGRPKAGESWSDVVRRLSDMTGADAAKMVAAFAAQFAQVGELTLKEAVVLRALAGMLFEGDAAMLKVLMDRADGKLPSVVRHEAAQKLLQEHGLTQNDIAGDPILSAFFRKAGIHVGVAGSDAGAGDDLPGGEARGGAGGK
jgi:hypothetical protein